MCFAFILFFLLLDSTPARHLQLFDLMPKQLETAVSHYNTYIDLVLNGNGAGALSCATISGPGRFFFSRPAVLLSCSSRSFFGDFYCRSFEFPALSRHPIDFQMVFFFLSVFPSISISLSSFLFFSCRVSFSFLVLEFDCVPGAKRSNVHIFRLFIFFLFDGGGFRIGNDGLLFPSLLPVLLKKNSGKGNKSRKLFFFTQLGRYKREKLE